MKYYLIAGETSGDLHGSNLMKGIKISDPQADFRFFGGDLMQQQGGTLVKHYRHMAYMGIIEVLVHLRTIKHNFTLCQSDIEKFKPDVIILIDYAGFNLKMAKWAKLRNFKVFYYITPKVWAWNESRVKSLKKYTDKLFVILPFEVDFFKKHGIDAIYCGNPLTDPLTEYRENQISKEAFIQKNNLSGKPIIALVAGSRKHEIKLCLPEMIKAIADLNNYEMVISGAPNISPEFYQKIIGNAPVKIVYGQTYDAMSFADTAVVTSGTATLETALLKTPQVVIYKFNMLSFFIGRLFISYTYFSLVNLIMNAPVVKEIFQFNLADKIKKELNLLLNDKTYRQTMLTNYDELEHKLHNGNVSKQFASKMVSILMTDDKLTND